MYYPQEVIVEASTAIQALEIARRMSRSDKLGMEFGGNSEDYLVLEADTVSVLNGDTTNYDADYFRNEHMGYVGAVSIEHVSGLDWKVTAFYND